MSNLNISDSFLDSYKKIFERFADAVPLGPEPEGSFYTLENTSDEKENNFFSSGVTFENTSDEFENTSDEKEDDFLSSGDQTAMTTEQLADFQKLLSNLEASKKRQQRQKSIEGRLDVYAQGLSAMMSNF